jgi:hypothetical protein
MNLEPRLQEYLQRKDFFDKNELDATLLEKQYMITNKDKQIINAYFNKNIYKKKDLQRNMYADYVEIPKEKQKLPSDGFRQDKRFERLKNKVAKEKEALSVKDDISELSRQYDLFSGKQFASMGGYNGNLEDEPDSYFDRVFPREPLDTNSFPESSKLLKQQHNPHSYEKPQKHIEPKIQYNQRTYDLQYDSFMSHKPTLDNIVGNIGSYKEKINKSYNFNGDTTYNSVQFNKNDCREEELDSMYKYLPEMTGSEFTELKNIDIETYIKYGVPTSKAKSLGFENPVEHHFSYIDSDIQNPNHVVNDRPQLSRLSNKQSVNYKDRKVY